MVCDDAGALPRAFTMMASHGNALAIPATAFRVKAEMPAAAFGVTSVSSIATS